MIRNTKDIISQVKDKSDRGNLHPNDSYCPGSCFMVMTDSFGDIPYSEVGLASAYKCHIPQPKYDGQEAIYTELKKELTEASAALSKLRKNKKLLIFCMAEILMNGKKLSYSLLAKSRNEIE
ncbi:MAG: SusD/RagB family nutrient-binding outer membrane lipoprotein [Cytophagaceae bacterium]|nr:SusD/RagB family nutrient-binding outer membrane lipoprotein [Cytophagaceae bacterium]